MSEAKPLRCAECGSELPRGLPAGLCPVCAVAVQTQPAAASPAAPQFQSGDTIGRYKLLQKIGEGGMGDVWMAEQSEPIRRKVALKVVKLGLDTRSVIARFEAERQALALMDHPNIAKVFDAGATDTGRPYFVMELVRGVRITDYCDQHNLTTHARLDLFMQVCHAIQHAHQKGIIHRDLKPSNILVTLHDGGPVPKVIDFGIAKATSDQRLTDKTLFTAFEQFMGTPAYMSPEQAEMSGLDIDTRSDIYSLGVLLYELLTSRTPFDAKELLASGIDEMRRTIREDEPARPSNRMATMLEVDRTEIAKHRQTEPGKLTTLLRGDLDWIVMKALEKDRARRYETASGLAVDIEHHLHNEPVVARPPTQLYRFSRVFRRNRKLFAAGTAVTLSLLAGSVISTRMFFRAVEERKRADERAAVIQAVNDLLSTDLLRPASETDVFGFNFKAKPGGSPLEALARAAASIKDKFEGQPLIEAKIRHAIGDAYASFDVKQPALAVPQYERAVALRKAFAGPDDPSTLHSMKLLAVALKDSGRLAEAIAMNAEALRLIRIKFGNESDECISFMWLLADAFDRDGQVVEAIAHYGQLVAIVSKDDKTPSLAISFRGKLAALYEKQKQFDQAKAILRESVDSVGRQSGPNASRVAIALKELGMFLLRQQKFPDAELELKKCLHIQEEEQPDRWGTSSTQSLLGASLLGQKKFMEAEKLLLKGYFGLKEHEDEIPRDRKDHIQKALERLVELYSSWDKPADVAEWRGKLDAFKATQP